MEYNLKLGEQTIPVNITDSEGESCNVQVQDNSYQVSFSQASANHYFLEVNGKGVNAYVSREQDGKHIYIDGCYYWVQDADELENRALLDTGFEAAPSELTPPMPSEVVRVMVGEGDEVSKGQEVVVVAAMKMESTLYAPFDGIVDKVNVKVGDKVSPGQILVDVKQKSPGM